MFGDKRISPHVTLPNLSRRSSAEVQAALKAAIPELPSFEFLPAYKSPCVESGDGLACLPYAYMLSQPLSGASFVLDGLKQHPQVR